jgi:hypothetical protein
MTTIAPHLSVEELGARYRAAADVIEKSHVQAIWLLAKGHGKSEVGELLGFSRRWLNRLIAPAITLAVRKASATSAPTTAPKPRSSQRRPSRWWRGTWPVRRPTEGCGRDRRLQR